MADLQFIASIVNSLAWPTAAVVMAGLLREQLAGVIQRVQSVEFPGVKAKFAALPGFEKMIEAAAKDAGVSDDKATVRQEVTEFSGVEDLASAAPAQAVIEAWGLLEYQLNVASDRLAPDQPNGWPQVAHNLQSWGTWSLLRPAVEELRWLRDYTVQSGRSPSKADAARYVSVAQDIATTLRSSFPPPPIEARMVTHE